MDRSIPFTRHGRKGVSYRWKWKHFFFFFGGGVNKLFWNWSNACGSKACELFYRFHADVEINNFRHLGRHDSIKRAHKLYTRTTIYTHTKASNIHTYTTHATPSIHTRLTWAHSERYRKIEDQRWMNEWWLSRWKKRIDRIKYFLRSNYHIYIFLKHEICQIQLSHLFIF